MLLARVVAICMFLAQSVPICMPLIRAVPTVCMLLARVVPKHPVCAVPTTVQSTVYAYALVHVLVLAVQMNPVRAV
jgi:hypothetical protein